jgi:hypothetical protein
VIPISTLHSLADEIGDPIDRKLSFINMTTRCGSTLLSQMLSRVPRVRVMSEPWAFVHIHGLLIQGKVDMDEYRRLVRSVTRVQCKRDIDSQMDHVVIKMTNLVAPMFPTLKERMCLRVFGCKKILGKTSLKTMLCALKYFCSTPSALSAFCTSKFGNSDSIF